MSEIHAQGGSTVRTDSVATRTAPTTKHDSAEPDSVIRASEVRDDTRPGLGRSSDRYEAVTQYSLGKILAVWAAAAIPMGLLAWIVAPWLGGQLGGRDPFIEALLICFNVGLLWQLVLVLILVRREQGSLARSRVRDALWLRAPRDPKTGRVGKKVWWWVLPFVVLSALVNGIPFDPQGPLPRDLPNALQTDRLEHFFSGNWGWFAMVVAVALLAPVVEELLFRGLLLPRMRTVFGRGDFVANGALFGLYHLHQPWSMPASVIDGIVNQAYPTKRFQSTWMGLITHTAPSILIIGVVLSLVLT
jgi:membrane protease YdiL (CAAX protease family)